MLAIYQLLTLIDSIHWSFSCIICNQSGKYPTICVIAAEQGLQYFFTYVIMHGMHGRCMDRTHPMQERQSFATCMGNRSTKTKTRGSVRLAVVSHVMRGMRSTRIYKRYGSSIRPLDRGAKTSKIE